MSAIEVQCIAPELTPLANKFYSQHGARGRANKQEKVFLARIEGRIVGAARIQLIAEHALLCGVFVAPEYRSIGVARCLINAACTQVGTAVFSFVYEHLDGFYQQLGFCAPSTAVPCELTQRFKAYQTQGRNILMRMRAPLINDDHNEDKSA